MFSTTYTVFLSPGPEERLANLKQHINKNTNVCKKTRLKVCFFAFFACRQIHTP
jgi:hypothetical protein